MMPKKEVYLQQGKQQSISSDLYPSERSSIDISNNLLKHFLITNITLPAILSSKRSSSFGERRLVDFLYFRVELSDISAEFEPPILITHLGVEEVRLFLFGLLHK
jgi:hypothetical protein